MYGREEHGQGPQAPPATERVAPNRSAADLAWLRTRAEQSRDRAFECKERAFHAVMTPATLARLGTPYTGRQEGRAQRRAATAGPKRLAGRKATVFGKLLPREHHKFAFGQKKVHLPSTDEDVLPPRMRGSHMTQQARRRAAILTLINVGFNAN